MTQNKEREKREKEKERWPSTSTVKQSKRHKLASKSQHNKKSAKPIARFVEEDGEDVEVVCGDVGLLGG